jgi:methionyl-tRNA formyltransferase
VKIVFFGSPAFAVPFLVALHNDPGTEVLAAVCQPDKPAGRGQEVSAPAVKDAALAHGITVLQPPTLKDEAIQAELRAMGADAFVVVAYGKLIPKPVLDIPKLGCVNVHPSLLPKYRGASPMQFALDAGDAETGITIMLLDEGMDTGPILAFDHLEIDDVETLGSLTAKVMKLGPPLLLSTLKRLAAGEIVPLPQDDAQATLTTKLEREDGRIDWTRDAAAIERRVRAYDPWPGTWTTWNRNGKPMRVKILSAREIGAKDGLSPGHVQADDERLIVGCGTEALEILTLQPEGKSAMTADQFLAGYSDVSGAVLG